MLMNERFVAADGDREIAQEAVPQAIYPAMHREFLAPFPGVRHGGRPTDMGHLLYDVQLAQQRMSLSVVVERVETCLVLLGNVLNMA